MRSRKKNIKNILKTHIHNFAKHSWHPALDTCTASASSEHNNKQHVCVSASSPSCFHSPAFQRFTSPGSPQCAPLLPQNTHPNSILPAPKLHHTFLHYTTMEPGPTPPFIYQFSPYHTLFLGYIETLKHLLTTFFKTM